MKNNKVLLLFSCILLMACNNDPIEIIQDPVHEEILKIEWATSLDPDQTHGECENNQIYKGNFIHFGDWDNPATINCQSSTTGRRLWTYEYEGWDKSNIERSFLHKHILVCLTNKRVFAFDLNQEEVIWEFNVEENDWSIWSGSIHPEGKFYLVALKHYEFWRRFNSYLLEFDVYTGKMEEILSYAPDSVSSKSISPPAVDDKQHLFFNIDEKTDQEPRNEKQYLVAFDKVNKTELWRTMVTERYPSNISNPPVIYDNRIIITGASNFMSGYDINTGEQIWKTIIDPNSPNPLFNITNHLIHQNYLYVRADNNSVTCLNPSSGGIVWTKDYSMARASNNMLYFAKEDMLIFPLTGTTSLLVVNAFNGIILHEEKGYQNRPFSNDIVYNEAADIFCTTTSEHSIGFTINPKE